MTGLETSAASSAKIVTADDTLKVDRTVALQDLNEGMNAGLRDLVAEHEKSAFEPVRLDPGPPPVMLTLEDLREHDEAQRNAYQRMDEIFRQAKVDQDQISSELRADLIAARKKAIQREATERAREFFAPMAERAATALATEEFYQPGAVLRRARFSRDDAVHFAATGSWVARLNAAHPLSLPGFARDGVVQGNAALASLVLENVHGRGPNVSDAVRHSVEGVVATLKLPVSDDGLGLVRSIVKTKAEAETAMRVFQSGTSAGSLGKIAQGILRRAD